MYSIEDVKQYVKEHKNACIFAAGVTAGAVVILVTKKPSKGNKEFFKIAETADRFSKDGMSALRLLGWDPNSVTLSSKQFGGIPGNKAEVLASIERLLEKDPGVLDVLIFTKK